MTQQRIKDWIVKILPTQVATEAKGTGFWAAEGGYVLTCLHVVEDITDLWIAYGGRKAPARILKQLGDIALLKVEGLEGPAAPLGWEQDWRRGDVIDSLGYQYESKASKIDYFPIEGTVSGESKYDGMETIALKEAIHVKPGSSGAPAYNRRTGRVIGIISNKWQKHEVAFVLQLESALQAWAPPLKPRFYPVAQRHIQLDILQHYDDIFVGREDVLMKIKHFLSGKGGEYYLLQGGAGIGKSALIAHLVSMVEQQTLGDNINYLVFFIREEGARNTPELFLDSLNNQLMDLLAQREEPPPTLSQKAYLHQKLWEEVFARLSPLNRLLVLIDGLDEAATQSLEIIIASFPSLLPAYCYWISTSRPLPEVLNIAPTTHSLRQSQTQYLSGLKPDDVRNLLSYYKDPVVRDDVFIGKVISHTRGEPLFLHYVCEDIAEWGEAAEARLADIPNEVNDYFRRQFKLFSQRTRAADNRSIPLEIFRLLTVTYSGLTAEEMAGILEETPFTIKENLELISRFLLGESRYELMHLEFRRTVEKELVGERGKPAVLKKVLDYCAATWQDDLSNETYAIRYYLQHLRELERHQELLALCEAGYLTTKLSRLINPEMLEIDYRAVFDACQAIDDLPVLLHWGLQRATISDQVTKMVDIEAIPATMGRLANLGNRVWWERGVGLCALIPHTEAKIESLLNLCKTLDPKKVSPPKNVFERIPILLSDITSKNRKDKSSVSFSIELCRWGETFIGQAQAIAEQIEDDRARSQALATMARAYGQLGDATAAAAGLAKVRAVAEQIEDNKVRSEALAAMAGAYGQLGDAAAAAAVLEKAQAAARQIKSDQARSRALAAVAGAYGQLGDAAAAAAVLEKAQTAARQIKSNRARLQALAAVAGAYGQLGDAAAAVLEKAQTAAEQIKSYRARSQALAAVARAYGQLGDAAAAAAGLAKVRAVAEQIEDNRARSQALAAVARAYGRLGDAAAAAAGLAKVQAVAEQLEHNRAHSQALAAIARAYGQLGDVAAAAAVLEKAQSAAEQITFDGVRSQALAAVARAYGQLGDATAAAAGLAKVQAAVGQIQSDRARSQALAAVAGAYGQLGDAATAAAGLARVQAAVGQIQSDRARSQALAAVAGAYGQLGDATAAAAGLAKVQAAVGQIQSDRARSQALAAVAQGFGRQGMGDRALFLINFIFDDDRALEVCRAVIASSVALRVMQTFIEVIILASQRRRQFYLQIMLDALLILAVRLPPNEVKPIFVFLEDNWVDFGKKFSVET